MTEVWQAGKTYVPGALARPTAGPAQIQTYPLNNLFEDGLIGWTVEGTVGWSAVTDKVYDGTKSVKYIGNGLSALVNNVRAPVTPGQSITAFCVVSLDHNDTDVSAGRIAIYWYDASNSFISSTQAQVIFKANHGDWQQSKVTGAAPSSAAFASIAVGANSDGSSFTRADGTGWYYSYGGPPNGLAYKAVQAAPGKSGETEPAWPPTLGTTVVDNEVTWEAVIASQIVYTARPINRSGATEPVWPTATGGFVHDGTIDWEAITPQVTDVNCPHSKIVAIASSKVYAADNDIIRYSATVNPLDWTTKEDAGYLPYGLQTYGSNPVAAMGLYRSNLVAFNAEGFQMWQVDEDPSATALLDALPVGSTHHAALSPVSNDLFFLSSQGVRTIGIAASSTNLQAGDVGMPIDELIKEALGSTPIEPIGTFVPAMGQYWLAISGLANADPSIQGDVPDGSFNTRIDSQYVTAAGTPPIVVDIMSGSLPTGATMDSTGHVTGTRSSAGQLAEWVVRATDASGRTAILYDSCQVGIDISPGLSDWKYLQISSADSTDYSSPTFNDSAWALGTAPFGSWEDGSSDNLPAAHDYDARFVAKFATNWTANTRLWMRRKLTLAEVPFDGLRIIGYIEDNCHFYINGVLIFTTPVDQPSGGGFNRIIDASAFIVGENSIAVRCDDEPPVPTVSVVYADFLLETI